MSKIGVFTFNNAIDNYGQVLQYLATQEYLNARGHDTCLIVPFERLGNIKRLARRFKKKLLSKNRGKTQYEMWAETSERMDRRHPRRFLEFKRAHVKSRSYSINDLSNGALDVVAVGSDQTWSWFSKFGFCDFEKHGTKKIAIAPSLGPTVYSRDLKTRIKPLLQDFDLITCREQSGVDLCEDVGVTGHLTLDPTFLLSKEHYAQFEEEITLPKRKYLFVYMLGAETECSLEDIHLFASKNKLDVVYVASQGRDDSYEKVYATIPQWLFLVRNAECVITNSFHGMAFSIIYRKKFLTLPLIGRNSGQNERINVLAHQLGLGQRIMRNDVSELLADIDYKDAEMALNDNRAGFDNLLKNIGL